MLNNFLSSIYLRYLFVILIAFELLFIGMDYLGVSNKLPDSANLKMLYSFYIGASALKITLPIAIVFAVIAAKIHLIRKNELVAIYSLGVNKVTVLLPFLMISFLAALIFSVAQGIFIYDAKDKATGILKGKYIHDKASNLFLKYNESYIYIKQLYPLQKRAEGIDIYEVDGQDLQRKISAEKAFFINNSWLLYNVEITKKPTVNGLQPKGIIVTEHDTLDVLKGFKPSIMDSVHEWKENLSFSEVVSILALLIEQDISTDRIRGLFYANYIVPFFAPLFVIIVFFAVPISMRFFNLAFFSSLAVFTTLGGWGVIFTLSQLASTGTLHPELAVLFPFIAVSIFAGLLFKKHL